GRGPDGPSPAGGAGGGVFSTLGSLSLINSTLVGNLAGAGGPDGTGGSGGGIAVRAGSSTLVNATIAHNAVGQGGLSGASREASGSGGGLFVVSSNARQNMRLENTIVASNAGAECAGSAPAAIANGGH